MTAQAARLLTTLAPLAVMGGWSPQPTAADTPKDKGPNAEMKAEQAVFHILLESHEAIRRTAPASAARSVSRLEIQYAA